MVDFWERIGNTSIVRKRTGKWMVERADGTRFDPEAEEWEHQPGDRLVAVPTDDPPLDPAIERITKLMDSDDPMDQAAGALGMLGLMGEP